MRQRYVRQRILADSVDRGYKKYAVFVAPFELYKHNQLPFGWKSSSAWFQKMLTAMLQPFIGKFIHVHIEDVLINSWSQQEHLEHLLVLQALSRVNLQTNMKKSGCFQCSVALLGELIDGRTKTIKEESVRKIRNMRSHTVCTH